jgi:hypothetical protein
MQDRWPPLEAGNISSKFPGLLCCSRLRLGWDFIWRFRGSLGIPSGCRSSFILNRITVIAWMNSPVAGQDFAGSTVVSNPILRRFRPCGGTNHLMQVTPQTLGQVRCSTEMDANSGWMASWAHGWAMESSGETITGTFKQAELARKPRLNEAAGAHWPPSVEGSSR